MGMICRRTRICCMVTPSGCVGNAAVASLAALIVGLLFSTVVAAGTMSAADVPTAPGLGFVMVGIGSGQSARLSLSSAYEARVR
jgi:hypothetical protein